MLLLALLFSCLAVLPAVSPFDLAHPGSPPERYRRAEAIAALARLTLAEKASQVLMISVPGKTSLPGYSSDILASLNPGGILLFGFNVSENPLELAALIDAIQDSGSCRDIPLAVAIDHEGGVVFRFGDSLTRLPSAEHVGSRPSSYAYSLGAMSASELRALGIAMVLAPVVELKTADNAAFLESRSYGSDPRKVDESAGAFIAGLQSWGPGKLPVAATAKHFPGNSGEDPHRESSVLEISRVRYEKDVAPRFASVSRRGVAAVMLSHARLGFMPGHEPSTISSAAIGGLLKDRLGFRGVALTDDLYMGAIASAMPPVESAVRALSAGADFIMLSSADSALPVRDAIIASVRSGTIPMSRLNDAVFRILSMKYRFSMDRALIPAAREIDRRGFPALRKKNREKIEKLERRPI